MKNTLIHSSFIHSFNTKQWVILGEDDDEETKLQNIVQANSIVISGNKKTDKPDSNVFQFKKIR